MVREADAGADAVRRTTYPVRRRPAARARPSGDETTRAERDAWRAAVLAQGRARCAVCGSTRAVQAHHVIRQQHLRRRSRELGVPAAVLLCDPRVGMPVCDSCHAAHHAAARRIPRALVPVATVEFVLEVGLGWLLNREYASEVSPRTFGRDTPAESV